MFTRSSIKSPTVTVNRETLAGGQALRGLVVNSGIANAGVGEQGYIDAKEMAAIAAESMGVKAEEVLVFSTGVIGVELPMTLIRSGVEKIELSDSGGNPLARAMMTTDTHPKEVGVSIDIGGTEVRIGGVAKGSGMIHPNMATMLCFVSTDAAVDQGLLREMLPDVADYSLNMLTVDGDSSTNDSLIVLANGAAGNPVITAGTPEAEALKAGLLDVCIQLTRLLARDGEGATHLLVVEVTGAPHQRGRSRGGPDHLLIAAGKVLLSTAPTPNWGAPAGRPWGRKRGRGGGGKAGCVHQWRLHHGGGEAGSIPQGCCGGADAGRRGDLPHRAEPGRRGRNRLGMRPYRGIRSYQQRLHHLIT